MSIYHGGAVERDRYGYVEFVEMQSVPVFLMRSIHFVSWLQGFGRSYIAMELMMMMAS